MGRRIAVIGKLMSGKTTLAKYLVNDHDFVRVALADAVKDQGLAMLNYGLRLNGVSELTLDREMLELEKDKFRVFLQWYGTDFWREYMEDDAHWIDLLREKVASMPLSNLVIDDVRFPNEVEAMREMGFTVFKLTRDEDERRQAIYAKYVAAPMAEFSRTSELRGVEFQLALEAKRTKLEAKVEEILAHPSEAQADGLPCDHEVPSQDLEQLCGLAWLIGTGYYDPEAPFVVGFDPAFPGYEVVYRDAHPLTVVGIGPQPVEEAA